MQDLLEVIKNEYKAGYRAGVDEFSDLFWDSDEENNLHNTHFRVFRKQIDSITESLFNKKSVVVYCDRNLSRHIGRCLRDRIKEKSRIYGGDSRLNPIECGFLEYNSSAKTTSTRVREFLISEKIGAGETWIVYNFDLISVKNIGDSSIDIDLCFNFLEKKNQGAKLVVFVDPDICTLPKYFEKHFDTVYINGISSPASLLPVFTFKEFQKIASIEKGKSWDDVEIEDININPEVLYQLYNYLSAFSPEEIRVILKMERKPDESFVDSVKRNRNRYLHDVMDLYSVSKDFKIEVPWLKKEKDQIINLINYSQVKVHANPHKKIRGIILYGPPGNSKTTLIKSICQDINTNYIIVSASDIKSRYLGDSEKAVKDLFRKAAQAAPCILVFDEMEALFLSRDIQMSNPSGGMLGIVSTLLQEMDSIQSSVNVFVIGTTNKLEMLDKAFLRPGRFDRIMKIDHPRRSDIPVIVDSLLRIYLDGGDPEDTGRISENLVKVIQARCTEAELKKKAAFSIADISHIIRMLDIERFNGNKEEIIKLVSAIVYDIDEVRADTVSSKTGRPDDSVF